MIVIKGIEYRSLEEQVYKNMIDIAEQALALTALDGRVTALEQGGVEPPANMMTTDTEQNVTGAKYFGDVDNSWFVKLPGDNPETDDAEIAIQYGPQSLVIGRNEIKKDGNYTYNYPNSSGTLATINEIRKFYIHYITILDTNDNRIFLNLYSSSDSEINTEIKLARIIDITQSGNVFNFPACILIPGSYDKPCSLSASYFHDVLSLYYSIGAGDVYITISSCSDVVKEI